MANWVRHPLPPFLSVSPLEYMRSGGAIPSPQKGYLSDTSAIPYENKANGCDTPPLCDTISKGYCAIWGGNLWAAKFLFGGGVVRREHFKIPGENMPAEPLKLRVTTKRHCTSTERPWTCSGIVEQQGHSMQRLYWRIWGLHTARAAT